MTFSFEKWLEETVEPDLLEWAREFLNRETVREYIVNFDKKFVNDYLRARMIIGSFTATASEQMKEKVETPPAEVVNTITEVLSKLKKKNPDIDLSTDADIEDSSDKTESDTNSAD